MNHACPKLIPAPCQNIAIPYYGLALDATIDALEGSDEEKLWQIAMSALRRALDLDDACGSSFWSLYRLILRSCMTAFWSDARLSKLVEPLVKQGRQAFLSQAAQLELYQATIQSLANAATAHFPVLQNLHQGLLRLARTDDESVQLSAIRALQAMWNSEAAPELISFKPESMPTIAELLEAGGQVEHETRQLLATMADGEEDAEMALDEDSDEDGSAGGEEAEDED